MKKIFRIFWCVLIWLGGAGAMGLAAESVSVTGITEPILDSTLGTQLNGILAVRKYQEGDFVRRGEVIFELDRRLEELEVVRREVVLEPLKADYEANKTLFDQPKSSVSKEILDKKLADYKIAQAEFELAKEQAQKRLITAPFDGFITEFFQEVGEACQVERPLLRMVDTRRGYFVAHLDSKSGHGLSLGQKVNLEIEAGHAVALLEGTISLVSPVVDPGSGLMKVKAVFDNTEGKIRPGVAGKMIFEETANVSARK